MGRPPIGPQLRVCLHEETWAELIRDSKGMTPQARAREVLKAWATERRAERTTSPND